MNSKTNDNSVVVSEGQHANCRQVSQSSRIPVDNQVERWIPDYLQPGTLVTGIHKHTDHTTGMLVLELTNGELALMSIYEIQDRFFDNLSCGTITTGTVDRVEFNASGNMTVILKGDSFRPLY